MSLAQDGGPVGEQEAPTCSKDSQREVGDGLPRVGLALGPAWPRPQDGQGPRMAVAPQQLLVLVAKDIQGGLETGRVPRLDHLLHQLQGQGSHCTSSLRPSPIHSTPWFQQGLGSQGLSSQGLGSQGRGPRWGVARTGGVAHDGGVAFQGRGSQGPGPACPRPGHSEDRGQEM